MDADFSPCLLSNDIEFIWSIIKNAIYSGMNLFIPKVRLRKHQFPRWFTPELRHFTKRIRTLRKRISKHPSSQLFDKLSQMEDDLVYKTQSSKSSYESQLIHSFAGKCNNKIYDYINSLTNSCKIPPLVYLCSSQASSDRDRAALFNSFFHSVFTVSHFTLPSSDNLSIPPSIISDLQIDQLQVLEALSSLDSTKSSGIDGIGPKLLKHCALALYGPIHHLFCTSLTKQVLPSDWKHHCITPIHKSGDKASVNNYRQISLLCTLSKVLERFVFDHLNKFFLENSIITTSQFGFRKHHSSVQQLLLFLSNVHDTLNRNAHCDVIYLDFRKAFDSVPHNELLLKLWNIGITGSIWSWLKEYLSNRCQQVSINGCLSSPLPVISGVPQGSILGPLLFLVYVNDLPSHTMFTSLYLFADDTKCLKPILTPADSLLLQHDLNQLSAWSSDWKLLFNLSKCLFLSFKAKNPVASSPHSQHQYSISGHQIVPCNQHTDLGVMMTSDTSWSNHIALISSKAYKKLGLLRRTFCSTNSIWAKKSLYLSLVRSQLVYCSQIWRPSLLKDIITLETIQRRATKFILGDYTSSYKSRLTKLHLLPLMMALELYDITFFIKSFKQPTHSFNILNFVSFNQNSTRSGTHCKLIQPITRTNRAKQFYFNRLPRIWNALPPIDLSNSTDAIVAQVIHVFREHYARHFNDNNPCTFHFCCPCFKCVTLSRTSFSTH